MRNYELALKFSKDYDMTCVSADGEIVYRGGFLTKTGAYDIKNEKLSPYILL